MARPKAKVRERQLRYRVDTRVGEVLECKVLFTRAPVFSTGRTVGVVLQWHDMDGKWEDSTEFLDLSHDVLLADDGSNLEFWVEDLIKGRYVLAELERMPESAD